MKRLSANVLSMAASDVVRRLFGFASIAYLTRVLSVDGFGAVGIATTILSYVVTIGSAGLHTYGTREVAQGGTDESVRTIVPVRFLNALVLTAATWLIAWFAVPDRRLVLLIGLTTSASLAHATFLEWYYQGKERMGIIAVSWTVSAAVYLALLVAGVRSDADLLVVGIASIAGDAVCAAILWRQYLRDGGPVPGWVRPAEWKALLLRTLPLGIGTIIATVTTNLPVLFLGIMMTNAEAGIYAAAFKLVFFLLMADRILGRILLPATSRILAAEPARLEELLSRAVKLLLAGGLPVCVGGMMVADQLLVFLFGAPYLASAPVFRVALWFFLLSLVHTVYVTAMLAAGKDADYSRVMMASGLLSLAAIPVYVSLWGAAGAAIAVVVVEGITLLLMRRSLAASVRIRFPHGFWKVVVAVGMMAVAVHLLHGYHVLVQVVLGALTYLAAAHAARILSSEEWEDLRRRFV